jgi:putative RNA 2'-phosphotransferase
MSPSIQDTKVVLVCPDCGFTQTKFPTPPGRCELTERLIKNSAKRVMKISKYLSKILRHDPGKAGIELDGNGWADVKDLISKSGMSISVEELIYVVNSNNKKRFSFDKDKRRIRANQGHSIKVDVELEQRIPPVVLFHGTAKHKVESILGTGLNSGTRLHVHLTEDRELAMTTGKRKGDSVVLCVESKKMNDAGFPFFLSKNNVWLTKEVPPEYLKRSPA